MLRIQRAHLIWVTKIQYTKILHHEFGPQLPQLSAWINSKKSSIYLHNGRKTSMLPACCANLKLVQACRAQKPICLDFPHYQETQVPKRGCYILAFDTILYSFKTNAICSDIFCLLFLNPTTHSVWIVNIQHFLWRKSNIWYWSNETSNVSHMVLQVIGLCRLAEGSASYPTSANFMLDSWFSWIYKSEVYWLSTLFYLLDSSRKLICFPWWTLLDVPNVMNTLSTLLNFGHQYLRLIIYWLTHLSRSQAFPDDPAFQISPLGL